MTRHLLVIGAQRCGTTYLHDLLAGHREIAMARPARPEPKVFLSDELTARGRDWYLATYFGHAGDARVLGEKSTSYLESEEASARSRAMLGDPLILVSLRDPVRRAISHWAFSTDNGLERRPLETALRAGLAGPEPWDPTVTSVSPFAYLERGRFVDYLRPWLEAWGSSLRVVMLHDLLTDPGAVTALWSWLGVAQAPSRPVAAANASTTKQHPLDPALERELRDYFRDSDDALADLLGRELPWRDRPEGG